MEFHTNAQSHRVGGTRTSYSTCRINYCSGNNNNAVCDDSETVAWLWRANDDWMSLLLQYDCLILHLLNCILLISCLVRPLVVCIYLFFFLLILFFCVYIFTSLSLGSLVGFSMEEKEAQTNVCILFDTVCVHIFLGLKSK